MTNGVPDLMLAFAEIYLCALDLPLLNMCTVSINLAEYIMFPLNCASLNQFDSPLATLMATLYLGHYVTAWPLQLTLHDLLKAFDILSYGCNMVSC